MELPAFLRQAIERELEGVPLSALRTAAETLSSRYRAETRDGRMHMKDALAVKAYLAARLPATYAAIRSSAEALSAMLPDFAPQSLLDVGAGPGTALWAASDRWREITHATLIEASEPVRAAGAALMTDAPIPPARWIAADAATAFPKAEPADLVTLAYVLDELTPPSVPQLVERLWAITTGVLLIVEPGTPAGWRRILDVRGQLIALGAEIAAPCPHAAPCPLAPPDWCHFSRRVARSRLHRLTKSGEVPWEDEKFIYLAASRMPVSRRAARVLAPPRGSGSPITLKLCNPDGTASERTFSKRDGTAYKQARRLGWGDRFTDRPSGGEP